MNIAQKFLFVGTLAALIFAKDMMSKPCSDRYNLRKIAGSVTFAFAATIVIFGFTYAYLFLHFALEIFDQ